MSAVQNRRPALELVPQPDTAGDDTVWSINDPAVTTDPAIDQPESWVTQSVLNQWAPEHQLIGALMCATASGSPADCACTSQRASACTRATR